MRVFAETPRDATLIVLALVEVPLLAYATTNVTEWSLTVGLATGIGLVFLTCTNFQCVAHNFIHNPFFTNTGLNSAFSVFNTLCIGVPQSLYRVHHLHHHKYNNDRKTSVTGTTNDMTSTFRHGKHGGEEALVPYALLGVFRSNFTYLWNEAKSKRLRRLVMLESGALMMFAALLLALDWKGFLFFYLPVWYAGHAAAMAQNYLEHHGAIPGDRRTDSVSSYGRLYNLVWFNNGYHQEHHWRPQVHWSKVPTLRPELPPESERRVVPIAHWLNFFALVRREH